MNTIHNPMTIHMNNQALIIVDTFIRLARLAHDNRNTLTIIQSNRYYSLCFFCQLISDSRRPLSISSIVLCFCWNQPSQKAGERKYTHEWL